MGHDVASAVVAVASHTSTGGVSPIDWLLWGGLAAALGALYIGVYVWMRRPKFGDGAKGPLHPASPSEEGPPSLGSGSETAATATPHV